MARRTGKTVSIVAHGNALRAMVKYFVEIADERIPAVSFPAVVSIVYNFDDALVPVDRSNLYGDLRVGSASRQRVRGQHMSKTGDGKIGFWEVVAIGVGGMVGGGIFAVLGLAVQLAHGGTPVAFAVAGAVALLTAYSYAKLSVAYPSRGGTVIFLDRAFGAGMITGSLNVLLWLSYVVMLSLYALAFGGYGATLSREARLYADCGGGDVVHSLRDQCHALRRGAVELLHCPRW